jgi:tetratricopeptide (TPR) repeat protein
MNPPTVDQAFDLAMQHHRAGRLGDAERICRQILAQHPQRADAAHLLGLIAHRVGKDDLAAHWLRKAIALRPDSAEAYRQAIALRPERAETVANLGIAMREMGRLEEAIANYRQAMELDPNYVDAHWNLALVLLSMGQFAEGWEQFEWRLRLSNKKYERDFPQPHWKGQEMPQKTLLVYAEGGLGDTLHFIRLLPMVKARVGKLIFECQSALMRLLADVPGVDQWAQWGSKDLPAFDCRISLVGLPRVLGIRMDNIPSSVPYLRAPRDVAEHWKGRVKRDGKKNIGLRWAGSPGETKHRTRDIGVFAPLTKIEGVRFYSLQKGPEATQTPPQGMELIDYTSELNDFADTAGLVENLDLVISVDTSVAHLAGAMAKPAWVMIPYLSDFRWLLERTDSPWYPTMRLFRQDANRDWGDVVGQIAEALRQWAAK